MEATNLIPNNAIKLTGMRLRQSALALSVSVTLFTGSLSLRYVGLKNGAMKNKIRV